MIVVIGDDDGNILFMTVVYDRDFVVTTSCIGK